MSFSKKLIKVIKFLSPTTLGVFLIHTQPVVFQKILKDCLSFLSNENLFILLVGVILAVIIIYVLTSIIDYLRILLFHAIKVPKILARLEGKMKGIVKFILRDGQEEKKIDERITQTEDGNEN